MGIIYKNITNIKDYFGVDKICVEQDIKSPNNIDCFDPTKLRIPDYQRPYKWTKKNVMQLMNDIIHHSKKHNIKYRLGTVVLHRNEKNDIETLDIVDGQQRTITLAMICHALHNENISFLSNNKFENPISQNNIYNNYQTIQEKIIEFDEPVIDFLKDNCELVVVILENESEAFQFFDSQNTRGKELYPHDLLKAYHLREIYDNSNKINLVETWEKYDSDSINELIGKYLYRIKSWSMGKPAIKFSKDDIHLFKGISESHHKYPYSELYRMADAFVENNSGVSKYVGHKITYPFQIDSVIINGERFFEMIGYYLSKIGPLKSLEDKNQFSHVLKELGIYEVENKNKGENKNDTSKSLATSIINFLSEYDKKDRTGDKYVRELFNCILMYYIDKFGLEDLEKAIHRYFDWAYSLRLKMESVYIESINNYALGLRDDLNKGLNPFEIIRNSYSPIDSIEFGLSNLEITKNSKLANFMTGTDKNENS